jgi:hypothetical protein
MKPLWFGPPSLDPELGDALRRVGASPPPRPEDVLRAEISLAAQPALRRLRARPQFRPWWGWTAGWARLTVPAGAGVALASALLLVRAGRPVLQTSSGDTVAMSSMLVSAGADAETGTQLLDRLLGPVDHDWLFSEAMGRP